MNCTCLRSNTNNLNRIDCSQKSFQQLPSAIPPNVKSLDMSSNNLNTIDNGFEEDLNLLTDLYLNNSGITSISSQLFEGMPNLQKLYLDDNNISSLDNGIFTKLKLLEELDVSNNKLVTFSRDILLGLSSLQMLDLSGNQLEFVDMEALHLTSPLQQLFLSNNPWLCDCSSGPQLQGQLVKYSTTVVDVSKVTCEDLDQELMPKNMTTLLGTGFVGRLNKSSRIPVLTADFVQCQNATIETVYVPTLGTYHKKVIISLVLITIVVITAIALVIYHRMIIQVWLFANFGIKLTRDTEDDLKQYDAFISYSQHDESVVTHGLLPELEEGDTPYRLCVHFRDWPVGGGISQSVVESVANSSRTIILLSNNFIKSEWCNYEFQAAHHKVLREMSKHLIIVMLEVCSVIS